MSFVMRGEAAFFGESFVTKIAREGSSFMPGHMVVIVAAHSEPFLALFTPITVVSCVLLVVTLQSQFAAERLVAPGAVVLAADRVEHAVDVLAWRGCGRPPRSRALRCERFHLQSLKGEPGKTNNAVGVNCEQQNEAVSVLRLACCEWFV